MINLKYNITQIILFSHFQLSVMIKNCNNFYYITYTERMMINIMIQ